MKRYIFFDVDGTLILTDGAGKRALAKAIKNKFGLGSSTADINFAGRTDLSICKELHELNRVPFVESEFEKFMGLYLSELEVELKKANGSILPGVERLLNRLLNDDRYYLGLITGNIKKGAFSKLSSHGIDNFFSFGGFGDFQELREDIAREGKRDAENLYKKEILPEQMLVIGDTPHDVTCSRAIGAKCLAVCTGYASRASIEAENPDWILENLEHTDQVLSLLDDCFSSGSQ